MKKSNKKNFIREALSEDGIASSKRLLGAIIILAVLGLLTHAEVKEGLTNNVTSLCEMMVGTAGLLLGISSITRIWNNPKKKKEDEE